MSAVRPKNPPKFDDCTSCRFYNRNRALAQCRLCGAGEFFEEIEIDSTELSEDELMNLYRKNYRRSNDE